MLYLALLVCLLLFLVGLLLVTQLVLMLSYAGQNARQIRSERARNKTPTVVGFFHPNCLGGGGGERVLWTAIQAMQERWPELDIVVYCNMNSFKNWSDDKLREQVEHVKETILDQFRLQIKTERLNLVPLKLYGWMTSERWPRFTLAAQSLGAVVPLFEGLSRKLPEVLIDTVGVAFTYPVAKRFFGCEVISYTHYPVISGDMLSRVASRKALYNNSSTVANSRVLSALKLRYYKLFARAYGWCGRENCRLTMVNSTWTAEHIRLIWNISAESASIVYPPCDTQALFSFSLDFKKRSPLLVVSVAQFRPEKNHDLQIEIAAEWSKRHGNEHPIQLVLIGGCRKNSRDDKRVQQLRQKVSALGLEERISFLVNAPYSELLSHLEKAQVGLHTMVDEHFGIGVIEYMAAGAIALAHNSGGPKCDIIVNSGSVGYLADTCEEYVSHLETIFLKMGDDQRTNLRLAARKRVEAKFSSQSFKDSWIKGVGEVVFPARH